MPCLMGMMAGTLFMYLLWCYMVGLPCNTLTALLPAVEILLHERFDLLRIVADLLTQRAIVVAT